MISVQEVARKQVVKEIDATAKLMHTVTHPTGGWLARLRQALKLPAIQLAARLGVSRAAIYQAERNEASGSITMSQMRKIAAAMDAEFVYAVVPKKSIASTMEAQARVKATDLVRRASSHMGLEGQGLSEAQLQKRVQELALELIRNPPRDFWASP